MSDIVERMKEAADLVRHPRVAERVTVTILVQTLGLKLMFVGRHGSATSVLSWERLELARTNVLRDEIVDVVSNHYGVVVPEERNREEKER